MKPQMIPVRYLYHGSTTKLPVGGFLLPPSETGVRHTHDADKIYLSTDLGYAVAMALEYGKRGWLYQVRPLGAVEPFDSEIIWNGRGGAPAGGSHFTTTTKAEIVARARVPKAFFDNRVPLIETHFALISALSTKEDTFKRTLLKNDDDPDDPAKWLITRGEQRWEQGPGLPWKWLQDVDEKQKEMCILFGRLYGFLEDHREEIIDAADEIPAVLRELLDLLNFRIEACADCGDTLNDADVRRGNGVCLDCESQQPD